MSWVRLDDNFDHHPKLLALGTDQRRYTWLRILVYTCRYRSPVIPPNITNSVPRATQKFIKECTDIGLVDHTDKGTDVVHNWDHYNGADSRLQARERARRHRERNADVTAEVTQNVTVETLQKRPSRAAARARPRPHPLEEQPVAVAVASTKDPARTENPRQQQPQRWNSDADLHTISATAEDLLP